MVARERAARSLGQLGRPSEEMAVGEDPDHEPLEQHLLSNDDPADFVQCGAEGLAQRFDFRSALEAEPVRKRSRVLDSGFIIAPRPRECEVGIYAVCFAPNP